MRRLLSVVAATAASAAFVGWAMPIANAAVTTLYVGPANCSDTGSGTQTQPFCTIIKAATVAAAGQTVLISTGTYSGTVSVAKSGTAGSPIVFQPAPGASVTIQGGNYGFSISGRSYVTVNGFTITGTVRNGISVSSSDHITISNNVVTKAGVPASGQVAAGIVLSGTTASTVTGNQADRNSDTGIYLTGGTTQTLVSYNEASLNARGYQRNANGINVVAPNNMIIGNLLHDNEDSGLQFYPGGDNNLATLNVSYNNGDHGIDDLNVTGGRLIGNTIFHNCTSGINVEGTSGNYLVENNIAVDNAVYPAYQGIACSRRAGNIGIWDSAPASTTRQQQPRLSIQARCDVCIRHVVLDVGRHAGGNRPGKPWAAGQSSIQRCRELGSAPVPGVTSNRLGGFSRVGRATHRYLRRGSRRRPIRRQHRRRAAHVRRPRRVRIRWRRTATQLGSDRPAECDSDIRNCPATGNG